MLNIIEWTKLTKEADELIKKITMAQTAFDTLSDLITVEETDEKTAEFTQMLATTAVAVNKYRLQQECAYHQLCAKLAEMELTEAD